MNRPSDILLNTDLSVRSEISLLEEESKRGSFEKEKLEFSILIIDDNDFNIFTLDLLLKTNFNLKAFKASNG